MAGRAVRSSSRRNTPQPQLPPTTRTTRSQSRDAASNPEGEPVKKTTRRGARGVSVESASSVDSRAGRRSRASRRNAKAAAVGDLSTVDEDVDVQYPELPAPTVEGDSAAHEVTPPVLVSTFGYDVHRSPGAQSNISGTTAISTAQTVHDPADLDAELMVEFLDDLRRDSAKVLDIVAPKRASLGHLRTVFSEVRKPGSRTSQVLDKRMDRFTEARQSFGNDAYISRDTVMAAFVRETPIDELGDDFRRPDAILYQANLATFAKQMITLEREKSDTYDVLMDMDLTFPRHFLSSLCGPEQDHTEPGSSALVGETFRLALEIRSQFAVFLLAKSQTEPDFDPDESLRSVFFMVSSLFEDTPESPLLRGWEVLGLGSGDEELPKNIHNTILRRVQKIRQSFQGDQEAVQNNFIDLEKLESDFPWSDFIVRILDWARIRNIELEEEIEMQGGVEEIRDVMKGYLGSSGTRRSTRSRRATSQSQRALTTGGEPQDRNIPRTAPGVLEALRRRLGRISGQGIIPEVAAAAEEPPAANGETFQPVENDWQPPPNDDEDISATFVNPTEQSAEAEQPRSSLQGDLSLLRQREKQNKENLRRSSAEDVGRVKKSVFDRQPNAQRVSFDDTQALTPTKQGTGSKNALGKRQRVQSDSDDEEDEFVVDRRVHKVAERRQLMPVAKRARYAASVPPFSVHEASEAKRTPSVALETEVEEDEEHYACARQYKAVALQAKKVSLQAKRVDGGEPSKTRVPWTDREIEVLHKYMKSFQHLKQPWKMIKQTDDSDEGILVKRDYVALKDKARNILKACLIAGQGAPEGFENVTLGAFHQRDVDKRRGVCVPDDQE